MSNLYAGGAETLPGARLPPRPCGRDIAHRLSGERDVDTPAGPPIIRFEPLHADVTPPARATAGSAGADLAAYLRAQSVRIATPAGVIVRDAVATSGEWGLELQPGERALIPLGFKARLPLGYEAQVRPRSGAAFRKGLEIPNAPGTVDADFPDEWMVIVRNGTTAPMRIVHGERIAQVVLARHAVLEWSAGTVEVTTDRTGGFGSTG